MKLKVFLLSLLIPMFTFGQLDSIQKLDEVVLSDVKLKQFTNTQATQVIKDSVLKRTSADLTTLLNYNTPIYFKENGLGMVSSPSFRGSTAQQTAVIWNGININSQTTGQTDFNTISTRNYNQLEVRSGGGSVLYGSGAIGGTIHLKNNLRFSEGFKNEVSFNAGSFDTYNGNYKLSFSDDKLSINGGVNFLKSDNDFPYFKKDRKNLNGQFYNSDFNISVGYNIDDTNRIQYHNNVYIGSRHFSLQIPRENKTKYDNFDTRNLVVWTSQFSKWTSNLRLAYLTESYDYYPDIDSEMSSGSEVKTIIAKYDVNYQLSDKITINPVVDFTQNDGEGTNIAQIKRQIGGGSLLLKHQFLDKALYEASVRKEITDTYESPVLYHLGLQFNIFKPYTLKLNVSKNFRIPTFNDLYWDTGGNLDLLPETAQQYEVSHEFNFKWLTFGVTGYYNDITNMIRWIPTGGFWKPENIDEVETMGIESKLQLNKKFGNHNITLNSTYGYTVSENKATSKQLIYVPLHKFNASVAYQFKGFTTFYEYLFVDDVFSTSDHLKKFQVDAYQISNIGAECIFIKKNRQLTIGLKAKNVFNVDYQAVLGRNMPGINYNTYINLKF
ncbi:TonB-dependent receptor plug domain-containing protein [Aurantibacter aestuarii]|uniref:TonB-dependent receptor n=1 Tax=Aurantibacter aestuarii TaxID=1266046 RepID=A0A2T1N5D1_9FLAO|nr:TonB-dependent receptor [Aurantibacter aestuarii]PSG86491.1 TonB-dependent receptor [Aurantibacter aestuarii]